MQAMLAFSENMVIGEQPFLVFDISPKTFQAVKNIFHAAQILMFFQGPFFHLCPDLK